MQQIAQHFAALLDQRVRALAVQPGQKPDTARVVLERRIVKALRAGSIKRRCQS